MRLAIAGSRWILAKAKRTKPAAVTKTTCKTVKVAGWGNK